MCLHTYMPQAIHELATVVVSLGTQCGKEVHMHTH